MSQITALGLTNGIGSGASEANRPLFSSDAFLRILIAELQSQDPLEPMDSSEFLSQMVEIQSLETSSRLSDLISEMAVNQEIGAAGNLIGKEVTGLADSGAIVNGTVSSVVVLDGRVRLMVDDYSLALSNLIEIREG